MIAKGIKRMVPLTAVGLVVLVTFGAVVGLRSVSGEKARLQGRLSVLEDLRGRYTILSTKFHTLSLRVRSGDKGGQGIVGVAQDVFSSLGLTEKIVGIKPGESDVLPSGERRETIRVEAHGLDLNAVVNLLYGIEHFPAGLQIGDLHAKTDFERPELLNLEFQLVLISQSP